MKYNNILDSIGHTPIIRINKLFGNNHEVWAKHERMNPGGSIKDRIALSMIEDAEKKGIIKKGTVIVEPTSGNTGIGLALVCAVKGYEVILVMPDSMSIERRRLMSAYGAKLELTPRELGVNGAIARAKEIQAAYADAWIPQQFENPANINAHIETTAKEIMDDFPDGFDYLITGVGTGGHITGVARVMRKKFPDLKVFAVEPALSAVISGGKPGPHPLQGLGTGFIPVNLDTSLLDGAIPITKEEAFDYAQRSAKEEGVFIGISSGAALAAVAKKLPEIPAGKRILTFNYDTGERYLSIEGLFT
ncbi:MAG: cysteine synthase A [Ignavibacteriaceae bacterium]|nr:cysteine synthase A [Ignavibacteriaceae bacterium]